MPLTLFSALAQVAPAVLIRSMVSATVWTIAVLMALSDPLRPAHDLAPQR